MTEKKKTDFVPWIVLGVVVLFLFVSGCSRWANDWAGTRNVAVPQTSHAPLPSVPPPKSSDEVYAAVQPGMTKEQVEAVAGRPPDRCSESQIAGFGESSICSWGTVTVTFSDGKVNLKSKL